MVLLQRTSDGICCVRTLCVLQCCCFCFCRPDASWTEYADTIMKLCSVDGDSSDDEEPEHQKHSQKQNQLEAFRCIFNGDWRDCTTQGLVHYCSLSCQCGCRSLEQLKTKAVILYTSVVMGSRPKTPALARWMRCGTTSKWFMIAFGVHGIYKHATTSLYRMPQTKSSSYNVMGKSLHQIVSELNDNVGSDAASAFILPELPECKIIRVRAKKALSWVVCPETPPNLAISIHVTKPADHFAIWVFQQQKESWWSLARVVFLKNIFMSLQPLSLYYTVLYIISTELMLFLYSFHDRSCAEHHSRFEVW